MKTLVANRGEIAVRIIRALKELDIETVAVYSMADRHALHTEIADLSVCIGPASAAESYLNSYRLLSLACMKDVDYIHPGIGFLAENEDFSELCEKYGIGFIGPKSQIIGLMGNKNNAKRVAHESGLPIIRGSDTVVSSVEECIEAIEKIGLPVVLKATSGGGGKGIRHITHKDQIEVNYELCREEAESAFKSSDLIVEQYLKDARHVEVQILADSYGNVIHVGDRECSIQRNNQKIIEEARCVNISDKLRIKLYRDSIRLAKKIGYIGVGTVEFLVMPDETYYFMEMNTRLQVEHTITELAAGIDLVKEQIRVAHGEKLSITQQEVCFKNYAMECRILAESPGRSFAPSFGKITQMHLPGGNGVRIDCGYRCGDTLSPHYDSLLLKLCCYAPEKSLAIKKMQLCLDEIRIGGIDTNIDFLHFILKDERFGRGLYDKNFVSEVITDFETFNTV
ncbi:MAG: ATP-grasp domain-containing protein [Hungatella sp.]|nr:ATP-grasp domain-containing protein [Hungatella sp.]